MPHFLEAVSGSTGQDNYSTRKTERGETELLYEHNMKELKLTK